MPAWRRRNPLRAQQLRREATPAERHLWQYLNKSQLDGIKFSRQIQIGPFYCDLLCRKHALAIELDGFSHDIQPGRDKWRDRILAEYGIRVLRFSNEDVFGNTEGVLFEIRRALGSVPPPAPPASGRGDDHT
ncbi:endonuclease domain-containing protein [Sphingomonas tabacisoli]|uniref:Endonuclease domain-containing protein n=1 Tax=Sphingomonas tabacisoli TaxID=2249466 RepID=A0ABW4I162_9SPHN